METRPIESLFYFYTLAKNKLKNYINKATPLKILSEVIPRKL